MFSEIFYGEIKPEYREKWNQIKDGDPYDLLIDPEKIEMDWMTFLRQAPKYFESEIQVDWGSYAYQCTKQELEAFNQAESCKIKGLSKLEDNKVYGVVFIEES